MIEVDEVESASVKGVVCVITGPHGNAFVGTCFSPCPAAGFDDLKWQRDQALQGAYRSLWKLSVASWLEKVDPTYTARVLSELTRGEGWKTLYLEVGYGT